VPPQEKVDREDGDDRKEPAHDDRWHEEEVGDDQALGVRATGGLKPALNPLLLRALDAVGGWPEAPQ
jgi:hypothetical protein